MILPCLPAYGQYRRQQPMRVALTPFYALHSEWDDGDKSGGKRAVRPITFSARRSLQTEQDQGRERNDDFSVLVVQIPPSTCR